MAGCDGCGGWLAAAVGGSGWVLHRRRAAASAAGCGGRGGAAGVGAAAASVRHADGGLAVVPGARCGGLQGCSCGPSGRVGGHDKTFRVRTVQHGQVFFSFIINVNQNDELRPTWLRELVTAPQFHRTGLPAPCTGARADGKRRRPFTGPNPRHGLAHRCGLFVPHVLAPVRPLCRLLCRCSVF